MHSERGCAWSVRPICILLLLSGLVYADKNGYVGSDVCAGCHKTIALSQSHTNMARSWPGLATHQLPPNYSATHQEGPPPVIQYGVKRTGQTLRYRVQMPGQPALDFNVEDLIGGVRHGLVFLFRVPTLDGLPLPRAPLVEGRYFQSAEKNRLELELGFPEGKPTTYETAFGRVLPPHLEQRCLECHAAPRTYGTHVETGVACENCHGPGQPHLAALGAHSKDLGILNPDKLPAADRMQPCAQCHAGIIFVEDAMPDDTLISDQVMAIKNSECWRQSAGDIACTNCHNPHQDATHAVLVARSEKTCLRCHSAAVTNHAGLCPVNRISGCVGCHMPDQVRGAFIMADHWIRVYPDQKAKIPAHNPAWRTSVAPKRLFLRMIAVDDREKAVAIHEQLIAGASFFELARANSTDPNTRMNGGFMGDVAAADLDPAWAPGVLKLEPGEISDVFEANGKYVIIQRMPRNFRQDAEAKYEDAMKLRKDGKQQDSAAELLESLKIYPYFLRALTHLAIAQGEMGNPQAGAAILEIATRLYPQDEWAHFNLGIAYGAIGNDNEIAEYKRTIEIDPDYMPAYLNWGAALYAKGQFDDAIQVYRQGLHVNPLDASLHYNLSVALDRTGKSLEAGSELTLAARIDPKYASH